MLILGQNVLVSAGKRNKPLRSWLKEWKSVASSEAWQSIVAVRRRYPSADGVKLASGKVVTIFNVKGNEYRLLALIDYADQIVRVLEVVTHREYDKGLWKRRY